MLKKHLMPAVSLAALVAARPAAVIGAVRNEAGAGDVAELLKKVDQKLAGLGDSVKQTAEEAMKQAKNAGDMTSELKLKADELLTNQTQLVDAQQKLTEKLERLETRNTDLEQQLAARGGGGREQRKTVGQFVVESDAFKAHLESGSQGKCRIKLPVKQAITSSDGSAGDLIWSDRDQEIVGIPKRRMTIRQLFTQGRTGSNSIEYRKQVSRTNNAAPVTEGEQKPESDLVWDLETVNVRTIAHWIAVTKQAMADAPMLQSEIDGELRYGLEYVEESQLLNGDGTGQNLSGAITEATAFSPAFTPASPTMIDDLRLALLQASLAEYPADGIVLHPTDWARIELLKDGEQRYLFANVMQLTGPSLWGKPVVDTQAMTVDKFLVGAFKMAGTIYDREDAHVILSYEDRDNFVKNMVTVLAEERLAFAIKRPTAMVYGDFGNVSE